MIQTHLDDESEQKFRAAYARMERAEYERYEAITIMYEVVKKQMGRNHIKDVVAWLRSRKAIQREGGVAAPFFDVAIRMLNGRGRFAEGSLARRLSDAAEKWK